MYTRETLIKRILLLLANNKSTSANNGDGV